MNGECTEDEVATVKNWYFSLEQEPDHVSSLSAAEEEKLEEHIYNRILNNIGVEQLQIAEPRRRSLRPWYAVTGIAASLLIVAGIWFANTEKLKDTAVGDSHTEELIVITNNTHQIYKSVLPDNSLVWLNPGAQIRFPKVFDTRFRGINMLGECFFEVTKNPRQPFIITSRSIITKVWGTSFRVRDDVKSNSADVSVLTGKVSVSIKGCEKTEPAELVLKKGDVMLYPHQKAIYLVDKHLLKPENGDEPAMQIWNRVNMTFDNKLISEIVPVLNSKFHVHIKVANEKISRYILNADMTGFNLPDVLEAFKKSLNVNYEIKNNVIELE